MIAQEPLLRLEVALERMLEGVRPSPSVELPLEDALGLVLAAPVAAAVTMPPWDNSAMDGFAVRSADVASASLERPVELRVTGESAAGHAPSADVEPGTAVRILTGAMIPEGADAVVPVEETDATPGPGERPAIVAVRAAAAAGQHVRRAGSDIVAGQPLLPVGSVIGPASLALLAAAGHGRVIVHRRPRVAVVSTGDELVAPGDPLRPGQIHDSNGPMLTALVLRDGAEARHVPVVKDRLEDVLSSLRDAMMWADVVVASGGVSVGAHDVVRLAFEALGRLEIWRVAVQPGKPLAFGRAPRPVAGPTPGGATDTASKAGDEVLLFGLPGNPVSSYVTFEIFVRPVLRALAGRRDPLARRTVGARLAEPVTKSTGRRAFLRVRLAPDANGGEPEARLAGGQGSHVISALAAADGLAIVPEDLPGLPAGARVEVWLLEEAV